MVQRRRSRAVDWHSTGDAWAEAQIGPTWDEMTAETVERRRTGTKKGTQRPPEATTKATNGHEPLGPLRGARDGEVVGTTRAWRRR